MAERFGGMIKTILSQCASNTRQIFAAILGDAVLSIVKANDSSLASISIGDKRGV